MSVACGAGGQRERLFAGQFVRAMNESMVTDSAQRVAKRGETRQSNGRHRQRSLMVRIVAAPLDLISVALSRLLSPRGVGLLFLALFAWLAVSHWLRPPLSNDIGGFQLPLWESGSPDYDSHEILYGTRRLLLLSPGMVIATLTVIGAVLVWTRPDRMGIAAGMLLAGIIGCEAAVVFNHPQLIERLEHENDLHHSIVELLNKTVMPEIQVVVRPRVELTTDYGERGGLLRGAVYLPRGRFALLVVPALAVLLATRGALGRRLRAVLFWGACGLVAMIVLAGPRLLAEWQWNRAVRAEARGDLPTADRCAHKALEIYPALRGTQRSWSLIGKIGFQRGSDSPAVRYFRASQWARNREPHRAVDELAVLAARGEPDVKISRWLAETLSKLADEHVRSDRYGAAEEAWQSAMLLEGSTPFYALSVAVLHSRAEQCDAHAVASLVDPLLPRIANPALRAALLSMVGDCYFDAGEFSEARSRYLASIDQFNLPKLINYRANRGLVGM